MVKEKLLSDQMYSIIIHIILRILLYSILLVPSAIDRIGQAESFGWFRNQRLHSIKNVTALIDKYYFCAHRQTLASALIFDHKYGVISIVRGYV